jgi:hypothetical protein
MKDSEGFQKRTFGNIDANKWMIQNFTCCVCLSVEVLKPRSWDSNAATLAFIALRYVKTRRQ